MLKLYLEAANTKKDIYIVYPGKFEPIHNGHLNSYNQLKSKFGNNVYIATKSENYIPYSKKISLIIKSGIPKNKIINTSGYNIKNYATLLKMSSNDILVFALSRKDAQRLSGSDKYKIIKDINELSIPAFKDGNEFAYIFITDTLKYNETGLSSTQIRDMISKGKYTELQKLVPYSINLLKKGT